MRAQYVKKKLQQLADRLEFKKENVIPIILSVVITLIAGIDSKYSDVHLLSIIWIVAAVLFGILLLLVMVLAGFRVIKSLFRISAGLSLLIFLAQSYCAVPRTSVGDSALMGLLGIGFLYMLFDFFRSLYKAIAKDFKKINGRIWSFENAVIILLFTLFACFFIWAIYQVIIPIILNLCVYKTPT